MAHDAAATTTPDQASSLRRGLTARHIRMIALGSAIGTGLFYGSAGAIQAAGPAVLLAHMLGGAVVFIVMRSLGEMAVRHPVAGSFGQYASRYIGPFAGFLTGWTFTFEMFVVALADVTAFGVYMGFWFPDVERWVWVLAVIFFITAANLVSVKVFGELEFWFALIKIVAIVAMIVGGIAIILFGLGNQSENAAGLQNLVDHGGFVPHGIWGILLSLTIVIFAFGGTEVIGITAGEAQDPKKVLPRAVNSVPVRILIFYVLALAVIMSIQQWNTIDGKTSPFVSIFQNLGMEGAAHVLNIVVITAALSAINADFFAAGRMLHGLAEQGQAPRTFLKATRTGIPFMTVIAMTCSLFIGLLLNIWFHDQVFFLIAALATFAVVVVWLMILISHARMKREIKNVGLLPSEFPVPMWPIANYFAMGTIGLVIVLIGVVPATRPALIVGAIWVVILILCYVMFVRGQGRVRIELVDETSPTQTASDGALTNGPQGESSIVSSH